VLRGGLRDAESKARGGFWSALVRLVWPLGLTPAPELPARRVTVRDRRRAPFNGPRTISGIVDRHGLQVIVSSGQQSHQRAWAKVESIADKAASRKRPANPTHL
jgi:hypothetical protein